MDMRNLTNSRVIENDAPIFLGFETVQELVARLVSSMVKGSRGKQGCGHREGFSIRDLMRYKDLMVLGVSLVDAITRKKCTIANTIVELVS